MAALVAALWAYDGWNDLNMVAGEVKRPERNIPIALIAGVATVGVLYVLVNAGVQYVLPASAIAASPRPASDAVALVMGRMGASIVSAGMALSMLVTLNGTIMSGARVPFAVARDGYFFRALAEVHPRFHTPSVAIVVQAILSILLLLLGANFRQLFSLAIFAEWLFYMIAGSTDLCLPPARTAGARVPIACGDILSCRSSSWRSRPHFCATRSRTTGRIPATECSSFWLGSLYLRIFARGRRDSLSRKGRLADRVERREILQP